VRTAHGMEGTDAGMALCALAALRAGFAATSLLVGPMAELLADRFLEGESDMEPWVLANLFWTLTMIRFDEDRLSALLRVLLERAERAVDDLDAQSACLILWSIATTQRRAAEDGTAASYETSRLLPSLMGRVRETAADVTPTEASAAVWALGALRGGATGAGQLLSALRVDLACALDAMDLAEASLALWGMAVLGHRDEELLDVAAERALELERTSAMRVLAAALPRVSWALAVLDFEHTVLLRTVADRFSPTGGALRYLRPESFHALLWAYRKTDVGLKFGVFRKALEAKLLYWLRTRLDYVAIDPRTPEKQKYSRMLDAVVELGRFGPDTRQCKRE